MPKKKLRPRSKLCKTGKSLQWKNERFGRVLQSGLQTLKRNSQAIVKLMKEQPRSEIVSR